ncbi:MAG: SpoIIE family protein phosphatase [Thermoanaerobaculia bacterium]|nr:SpoIIE family protein phosphatase [Thermoanaerobaculia bacterium]MBP7812655.1 SpoIIE family protein phosphatase [Thermoanaerobaculia bacterium]MBP8844813.1 SpoIIE family protein phosphatase [Thermoanaerobaculia bacterium]
MIPATAALPWRELTTLAGSGDGEQTLVARLLAHWRAECGAGTAALYLAADDGWRLVLRDGEEPLPPLLSDPARAGLAWVQFSGALVAWPADRPGEVEAPASPLSALLALAARGLRLGHELKLRGFEADYRGVELEALYDVGLAIASTLDLDRLGEEILLRAVSLLDARRAALYLQRDGVLRLDRAFGGAAAAELDPAQEATRHLLAGGTPPPAASPLPGTAYLLTAPIAIEGVARGLLAVADKESRHGVRPFRDTDERTLALLANQAAIALENAHLHRQALEKERLEREMELASEIQRGILPRAVPAVPGFELAGWNRPARHVGGDYFDFLPLPGGRLALTLGDVSGKGVAAALLVSTLHSALHLLVAENGVEPRLFERLNEHILAASATNRFITLFLADLAPATGELGVLNAGHNPGLVLRATGELEQLVASGLPIGLMPGVHYRREPVRLEPGDLLCLYSDGITEATSPEEEEFGLDRLTAQLARTRQEPLDEVIAALGRELAGFTRDAPQGDDQTIVLMRRERA